jgi:hypothetical protein
MNDLTPLIWDNLYRVAIPDILTQRKEYLEVYGVYHTGEPEIDKMVSNNYVDVMLPISKIAEMYADGFELRVHSRIDMLQMYRDIMKYTSACFAVMETSINLKALPYKDLIKLDNLAAYIYDKASLVELVNEDEKRSSLDVRFNISSLFGNNQPASQADKADYDGFASIFKQRMRRYGDRS